MQEDGRGGLVLEDQDGKKKKYPARERKLIKDYFMPERCLYCMNKLNSESDISFGDNYTDERTDNNGGNSVVIRSQRGQDAWHIIEPYIIERSVSIDKIRDAQKMDKRVNNLIFSKIKKSEFLPFQEEDDDVSEEQRKAYEERIRTIRLGCQESYKVIYKETHAQKNNIFKRIMKVIL
ncbi:MAG: Coenzyme F420 hydrogenase/dehydrogenase, beta subunit C-terminal domain [Lachnospiraceae bacterium]|nr:Coenzyme F420 hydrogenase/dehydrogenase, beta subunit C-terminal domain [Lachnospiraceae bacterium]